MNDTGPFDLIRDRESPQLGIVHGVLSLDVGGLERIVLDLVRAGKGAGHRVSILCVEKPGALAGEARRLDVEIVSLGKPAGRHPEIIAKAVTAISALRPDVVHTHQAGALWYLGQAAKKLGLPVLHTEHGNHLALSARALQRLKTRLFLSRAARYANRFCCVSDEIAQMAARFRTVPRRKLDVIPNGIRMETFADRAHRAAIRESLSVPADAQVVGTVGRLSEVKHQELMLRAIAKIPNAWLLLVGDGPERSRLEHVAIELGVTDRTRFAGYQQNPERYLQAMDAFALSSRSEGMPVSLLEAWAAGLPVVCSAVGGIPEIVMHQQNGLLFQYPNVDGLVDQLQLLISNADLRQKLGNNGRQLVREQYSVDRMFARYIEGYRRIMANRAEASQCASSR